MISTNKETNKLKPINNNKKKQSDVIFLENRNNNTEIKNNHDSNKILVFRKNLLKKTNNTSVGNKKRVISSSHVTGNADKISVKRINEKNANKSNSNLLHNTNHSTSNIINNVTQRRIFYSSCLTEINHIHTHKNDPKDKKTSNHLLLSPSKNNTNNSSNEKANSLRESNIFNIIKEHFQSNSNKFALIKNRSFNCKAKKLELLSDNLETNKKIVRILTSKKTLNYNRSYNNTPTKIISEIENFNKKLIDANNNTKANDTNNKALTPLITNKSNKIFKSKLNTNVLAKQSPYLNKRNFIQPHKNILKSNQMIFSGHLEDYIIGKELGKGSYAVVKEGFNKLNSIKVAIKIYDKFSFYDSNNRGAVRQEIEVMKQLKHENIVKLYEAIFYQAHIYLVMELVTGISLFDYLKKQTNQRIEENECKKIYIQIVKAINHCHIKNISHRDIKLENIILTENNSKVKLIDFGFGCKISKNAREKFFCGTPSYMPPEIAQKKGYSPQYADIWSLGVLLYLMLYGNFPFKANYEDDLYNLIVQGKFECSNIVTDKANNLIKEILKVNPLERPSAGQILQNKWFENI